MATEQKRKIEEAVPQQYVYLCNVCEEEIYESDTTEHRMSHMEYLVSNNIYPYFIFEYLRFGTKSVQPATKKLRLTSDGENINEKDTSNDTIVQSKNGTENIIGEDRDDERVENDFAVQDDNLIIDNNGLGNYSNQNTAMQSVNEPDKTENESYTDHRNNASARIKEPVKKRVYEPKRKSNKKYNNGVIRKWKKAKGA